MDSFVFHNPTKLIFGKGKLEALKTELPRGGKILLVYGGGSVKRNGIYQRIRSLLDEIDAEVHELPGVEPNPRLSTVHRGVEICRSKEIDFLLAVGGGSVIDSTKAIAVGAKYDGDVWEIITRKAVPEDALPLGTVLTHAATGSEMNHISVITNWETKEKIGWASPRVYPRFSILDPTHTLTVPKEQTVFGIVDMMSHALEEYFSPASNVPLQERFVESILTTVIETAPKLVNDLENYEYRETVMLCGTMALNGVLKMGMKGDWATHNLEHAVSAVYDIPHGAGLAILFPNWMRYMVEKDTALTKFQQLAIRVFGVDPSLDDREIALQGIDRLSTFWSDLGAPSRLADYGIGEDALDVLADKAMQDGPFGRLRTLEREDVLEILRMSL